MSGASAVHMNIFGLHPVVVFGNDAQKADLTAAVATLSAAVAEAKKALYRTLADN